jgi:predicted RNase H-related nuclease YkuK (DUF458 family)
MKMNRKTLELLLVNYQNINNGIHKNCAEKQKFVRLIKEVEGKLKSLPKTVVYPDGMTAMEYAHKLAKDANERL